MTTMEQVNEIWKSKTGENLTDEEAWKMVDFIKTMMEIIDKEI